MVRSVVRYGHPVLRRKGAPISEITPDIERLIADMLETMNAANGIGLAAQQVGETLQLTVIDVRPVTDRPSTLQIDGDQVEPADFMPLVLINPEVKPVGDTLKGPEGCLSFPEIYADVPRPDAIDVSALNQQGQPVTFRCGGLLARAVQHEVDHLHGILFIDRMSIETKRQLKSELEALQSETKAMLKALSK